MNLEQQHMYGVSDWRLPSPSSTPKSTTFPDIAFQTPRTDSFSTHFLDAWSTPRANVRHTSNQTPLQPKTVAGERPSSSYSQRGLNLEDPNFHVNHLSPTSHLPLPPVEPSRRLSSSPGPLSTNQRPNGSRQDSITASSSLTQGTMDTSQIQTPPPTRDASSSRKRGSGSQGLTFNTPSTLYSRRESTPANTSSNNNENAFTQTPDLGLFPALQFPPDMVQFPNTGPATAPVPPQARPFWDPNTPGSIMNLDSKPTLDDPFAFTPSNNQNMFSWQGFDTPENTSRVDSSSMPAADDPWTQTPAMVTTSSSQLQNVTGSASSTTAADHFAPTTSAAVDPSMLFSFTGSPTRGSSSFVSPQRPQSTAIPGGRLPYEHQTRESQREMEMARKLSGQHSHTSTASSSAPAPIIPRPSLQRSNTHNGFVRRSSVSTDPHSAGNAPIPRKTSPSKRMLQSSSLASISEHTYSCSKTRLVVDEFGNARTETIRNNTESPQPMDHRTRYSGLWDDDDSDNELDASTYVPSQNTSFTSGVSRRNSKHGRSGSLVGRSQSVKHSKSSFGGFSFSDSLAKKLGQLSTDNSPVKQRTYDANRRNSTSNISISSSGFLRSKNDIVDGLDGVPENGSGDAQDELKKVVEKAKWKRQESINAANATAQKLEAHNQRWRASADVSKMNPSTSTLFDPFIDNLNMTPSTVGGAEQYTSVLTPGTERSSASSEGMRCVCNSTEWDGQLMVQCESCTKWQHARCLGLPLKPELLPPVYVCVFCTGTTPVVRGGRIREPFRQHSLGTGVPSPLGYKSGFQQ